MKTLGHARAGDEKADRPFCYHQTVKTFEELELWNDMIFVDVRSIGGLDARNAGAET
jgi:hypothetical protein